MMRVGSLGLFLSGLLLVGCGDDGGGATPGSDAGPGNDTGAEHDGGSDADAHLDAGHPQPGEQVRSLKARITDTGVSEDRLGELTHDNADFAFDLLRAVDADGNLFFSPHSISIALAMTYGGARGQTATDMATTLHYELPGEELHPAFNALDQELASRGTGASDDEGDAFALRVVNALWGQTGYMFLDSYLDLLAENYGAGLTLLDFAGDTEASRATINGWVSDQTEWRIPELLAQGVLTSDTVLVLTNAIYFKASWLDPFERDDTEDGTFITAAGPPVTVPMMHAVFETSYGEGMGYQALRLPYVGNAVSMLVLLPAAGTLAAFEEDLNADTLTAITDGLGRAMATVTMPAWQFRTQLPLRETLSSMGMQIAFNDGADFSGIDGSDRLVIQDVVHEAFVAVDEEGTEAAAATAVVVGPTSVPEPVTFTADRPFLFVIQDDATGAVLFVGRVTDPSPES